MVILNVIAHIASVFLNILLECVIFARYNILDVRPDSIIIAIVVIGIVSGPAKASIYGFICGLILDMVFSDFFGLYLFVYTIIGLVAGFFSNKYFSLNIVFPSILCIFAYMFKEGVFALSFFITRTEYVMGDVFLRHMLPGALLTAVLCIPVYIIYYKRKQKQLRKARFQ